MSKQNNCLEEIGNLEQEDDMINEGRTHCIELRWRNKEQDFLLEINLYVVLKATIVRTNLPDMIGEEEDVGNRNLIRQKEIDSTDLMLI